MFTNGMMKPCEVSSPTQIPKTTGFSYMQKLQKNGCNGNVNIDVHARQGEPPKDLPGLNRVKLSVICSLINPKWVSQNNFIRIVDPD